MRRSLKFATAAMIAFAAAAAAAPAHGDDGLLLTETLQLKVAETFLAESEYYRAVTEYRRFLALFPASARADEALFGAGLASWRGEDYTAAARFFGEIRAATAASPLAPEAAYLEAASWLLLKHSDRALELFDALPAAFPQSEFASRARLAAAVAAFGGGAAADARSRLAAVAEQPADERTRSVALAGLQVLDRAAAASSKSPAVAAGLSLVVPGSGQLYAGRTADGLTAFAIHALWVAGAIIAARQENWALAALATGVGLPFYTGNVQGAANAARRWNLGLRAESRERLAATLDLRF